MWVPDLNQVAHRAGGFPQDIEHALLRLQGGFSSQWHGGLPFHSAQSMPLQGYIP